MWTWPSRYRLWVTVLSALALGICSPAFSTELSWQTSALSACARHGCEGKLLIAIGLWEPDKRGNETVGDDGLSFGRFQMRVETASRFVLGRPYRARELTVTAWLGIAAQLKEDATAVDLAAQELARCSKGRKYRQSILKCWNPGADYPDHVLAVYRSLK